MPRFWLDATSIRGRLSGIGYYTLNLINALSELQACEGFDLGIYCHPSVKNWLLGRQTPSDRLQPYPVTTLPLPVTLADAIAKISPRLLPSAEKTLSSPDLLHGADHYVYPCPTVPKVMTIHDLTFLKYPQYSTPIVQQYRSRIQRCLTWTDLIITFAESTKQDIIKYFGVDPAKITITPQASRYQPGLTDIASWELRQPAIAQILLGRPYLLFVSTLEPRKNVVGLIAAFNHLKQTDKIPHQLVLIGQKGWKYTDIFHAIANSPYRDEIHHLNYLSEEALAYFYTHAEAFIYPSFYEGFGLPILEAMTLGAPVITSNLSSLPEVAGDAAILVDPHDVGAIASGICQVIHHPSERQALIDRGKERAKLFSWRKTAQLTLAAYRSLVE